MGRDAHVDQDTVVAAVHRLERHYLETQGRWKKTHWIDPDYRFMSAACTTGDTGWRVDVVFSHLPTGLTVTLSALEQDVLWLLRKDGTDSALRGDGARYLAGILDFEIMEKLGAEGGDDPDRQIWLGRWE